MNRGRYEELLQTLIQNSENDNIPIFEHIITLEQDDQATLENLLEYKSEHLTEDEWYYSSDFLHANLFDHREEEERIVLLSLVFEVEHLSNMINATNICESYEDSQMIFQQAPGLIDERRDDLIDSKNLTQINNSEIFKFERHFIKLPSYLDSRIPYWARSTFSKSPNYIRINTDEIYSDKPPQHIVEAVTMPMDPNWWQELRLFEREDRGGQYILQEPDINNDPLDKYRDYFVKNVRKLEVHYHRETGGNLRGMVEELVVKNNIHGFTIGRCIHFDTDDPVGVSFNESVLNHLDLSVNFYFGEDSELRNSQNLGNGKVQDASVRTHLFRIENVPFNSLLAFSRMFFISEFLLNEWISNQFRIEA